MLDRDEKEKPCRDGDEHLDHRPYRDVQHAPQQLGRESREAEQPVFAMIDPQAGVDDEEYHRDHLRGRRGDRRSGDAHGRQAQLAENQHVVQYDVRQYHDDRVQRQRFRIRDADEERPEHNRDEREKESEHAPVRVADGGFVHFVGADQRAQHHRSERVRYDEHHGRQRQQEQQSLLEQRPDQGIGFLAVAPRNQNLSPDSETESEHENHQIIYASEGRGSQLYFAHATEKSRVGQPDHVLHQQADENRVGDRPYLLAGRFHKACGYFAFAVPFRPEAKGRKDTIFVRIANRSHEK